MGRVADAIADIEEQLEAEIQELEKSLATSEETVDILRDEIDDLTKQVGDYEDYVSWVGSNYPDALATYQALEKLKK